MKVLVINAGSSSVKYQLVDSTSGERLAGGQVEQVVDYPAALAEVVAGLAGARVDAVGHRVVHGGATFSAPTVIDDDVLDELRALTPLAPLHNPANVVGIEAARRIWPDLVQAAVFDTAFHGTLPPHAFRYAVPEEWYREHGVRRYGFHGTSHAFVAREAARILGRPLDELDLITAHLGNGASMAAISGGRSVDTSMGLSPLDGLVMGTRSGDVDPAVITHVASKTGRTAVDVVGDLNRASGLFGLCGESDMRAVVARSEAGDEAAELALGVFCYRVRKYVGAYLAALGRCDALVFTGGIGEHAPTVRSRICSGLEGLGFRLDRARNQAGEPVISAPGAGAAILVAPTDEERSIAEQTAEVVAMLSGDAPADEVERP